MFLYPAIDLVGGKAVRLFKGDYAQMTVYSDDPVAVAKDFQAAGSKHIHLVGDCNAVGNLRTVIWGAWDVCMKI